ncbi:hypothetical protein [Pseudonocardia endophytica]|uniref:Transmembrane protein n=1 Tax=Pseudonocardia endophytica TaxID=401976 RepID=A0A4R1HK84_PSEEN|nr:hypothetical protein [Pseudonocardia endophytica]TCK22767.1 hypothetical protein EV378_6776 [Pseudonocardia endophytica]
MDARLTGRQRRTVDAEMSRVLGNDDRPPMVSGWTEFVHNVQAESQIAHGQPRFPHAMHVMLTVLTGGLWALVWWAHWMGSARRRYQRARRAELRQAGLYNARDLFTPGGPHTRAPGR